MIRMSVEELDNRNNPMDIQNPIVGCFVELGDYLLTFQEIPTAASTVIKNILVWIINCCRLKFQQIDLMMSYRQGRLSPEKFSFS